jgi:hypothetical protein
MLFERPRGEDFWGIHQIPDLIGQKLYPIDHQVPPETCKISKAIRWEDSTSAVLRINVFATDSSVCYHAL